MNTYNIAGLTVNFEPYGVTQERAQKYICEYTENSDITIAVSDAALCDYMRKHPDYDRDWAYYMVSGFLFYRKLLDFDGFMLHSSAVGFDGSAYLFSGQSGIGKSTHVSLWKKQLSDAAFIINDDKPAIRIQNGKAIAYGTPWSGKNDISENVGLAVKGISFINRGEQNSITAMDKKLAAVHIINQLTGNFTDERWEKILSLVDKLIDTVPVYRLVCNISDEAARLSIKTMTGGDVNEN